MLIELHRRRARSGDISSLTRLCYGGLDLTPFHNAYYAILSAFARKQLRRLMISIPPQHGKSLGSTVMLPSHLVTIPNTTVAIGSYSQTSAERLMRGCRRTIQSEEFQGIYSLKVTDVNTQRLMAFDNGSELMAVGREGSLTGNKVDVMILDDLYKDALEANSPLIRENCWEWYTSVVRSREHNDSCEIIVFTRWHEEDLIGRIKEIEEVVEVTDLAQLDNWSPKVWAMINFEAIKTTLPTPLDPREEGQALWEDRHSVETLREKKKLDPTVFECLYQGNPQSKKGLLYTEFTTYDTLPNEHGTPSCCIDVADTGREGTQRQGG